MSASTVAVPRWAIAVAVGAVVLLIVYFARLEGSSAVHDPIDVFRSCYSQSYATHRQDLRPDAAKVAFLGPWGDELLTCLHQNLATSSDKVRANACFGTYRQSDSDLLGCLGRQLAGLTYAPPPTPALPAPPTPLECQANASCASAYYDCIGTTTLLPQGIQETPEDDQRCAKEASAQVSNEAEAQRLDGELQLLEQQAQDAANSP